MKYFSKEHEWITVNGNIGTVGISDYAQKQLGDVVYVSMVKEIGTDVVVESEVAEIESVKSVSPVYAPVSGKILEFNSIFKDESNSGIINKDPYGHGWIFKIELKNKDEINSLMDEEKYNKYLETL